MQSSISQQNSFTTEKQSYSFLVGQTKNWIAHGSQLKSVVQTSDIQVLKEDVHMKKHNSAGKEYSPLDIGATSDDSVSTDEGAEHRDFCQRMIQMFNVKEGKQFELDARVGLNGSQTSWSFPCVLDESSATFFVWLADISIECFTKTTFLSITNFAEAQGAESVVLVQFRDHVQKAQFQKLFKVLDAERLNKRELELIVGSQKIEEYFQKYALYKIELQ